MDKYVDLIYDNIQSPYVKGKSHRHHIIPRCYFTHIMHNDLCAAANNKFTVNILVKEHLLTHCYLCLSANNELFKWFMYMSIKQIIGSKYLIKLSEVEKLTYTNLNIVQKCYEQCAQIRTTRNPMHVDKFKNNHDIKMRTPDVRKKISKTLHNHYINGDIFTVEHREKLRNAAIHRKPRVDTTPISKKGYVGGVSGLVMLYSPDGHRTYKKPHEVDTYIKLGYNKPVKKRDISSVSAHLLPVGQPHTYTRHISKQQLHDTLSKAHTGKSPGNKGVPCAQIVRDKIRNSLLGRRIMTNGITRILVKQEDFDIFLKKGFVFVRNQTR